MEKQRNCGKKLRSLNLLVVFIDYFGITWKITHVEYTQRLPKVHYSAKDTRIVLTVIGNISDNTTLSYQQTMTNICRKIVVNLKTYGRRLVTVIILLVRRKTRISPMVRYYKH